MDHVRNIVKCIRKIKFEEGVRGVGTSSVSRFARSTFPRGEGTRDLTHRCAVPPLQRRGKKDYLSLLLWRSWHAVGVTDEVPFPHISGAFTLLIAQAALTVL
jgi:hypothetical protein